MRLAENLDRDLSMKISTHALTWSATALSYLDLANRSFQLTHSRGVRPAGIHHQTKAVHFNSRTHVECDKQNRFRHQKQRISTHALTWSATFMIFVWNSRQLNFNSRTHVECDGLVLFCDLFLFHFNSRTHVECDGSPHVLR